MRVGGLSVFVALLFVLCDTDHALAWGPATHVGFARDVLANLGLLPAAVAAILWRHGLAYVYGNIAADIVFAKRLSRVKQFCHHWATAFRVHDSAQGDEAKAFAYGYLSHLAADTVAHGKYVPRQVMLSGCNVRFGHIYWELRADSLAEEANWRHLERVLEEDHDHHHEALATQITNTLLSYDLNRMLFEQVNALAVRQSFRGTMGVWNRCSRWYLSPSLVSAYRSECVDRIVSILSEGARSSLLREDPNGTSALMQVRVRRREQRRLKRQGVPTTRRMLESSRMLAPQPWHEMRGIELTMLGERYAAAV
ncbi:MAG: zinc dependent phospholipase C family protein [Phycisphaerae bacterium]